MAFGMFVCNSGQVIGFWYVCVSVMSQLLALGMCVC